MDHPSVRRILGHAYNAFLSDNTLAKIPLKPEEMLVFADSGNARHLLMSPLDIDCWRHMNEHGFIIKKREYSCFAAYADCHVSLLKPDSAVRLQP